MNKNVSIIDCAIEYNSIHCFNRLVSTFGIPLTYHYPPHRGMDTILTQHEKSPPSAYIIFGSTSNVCDRLDWQINLAKFIKDRLIEGIPVLGICFGHQLISDTLGGSVEKNEGEIYFEGTRKIEFINSGFGFSKGETLNIVTSHGYRVKDLGADFIPLAKSSECEFDVLCHSKYPLLTIQGHPEASDFFVNDLDVKLDLDRKNAAQKDGLYFIEKFLKHTGLLK